VALNVPEAPELVTPGDIGDELASFTRAMREEWIGAILETSAPATAHNRWRGLQP
jgi:hypothetical protein